MLNTVKRSAVQDAELFNSVLEIRREISMKVILWVGISYLAGHLAVSLFRPGVDLWAIWSITLIVLPVCLLSSFLLKDHYYASQALWHLGLFCAITVAYLNFHDNRVLYVYCLIPFSLILTVDWKLGALAEVGMVLGAFHLTSSKSLIFIANDTDAMVVLVVGLGLGFIAWALSDSLFLVVDWYLTTFSRSRDTIEENRQQRIQLAMVIKNLDQAYYRLQRTNAEMVAAWKAAAEAERIKTEFATQISHELRTPLNLIVGFSEMMMTSPENYGEAPLPGSYRRDLNTIYRSARHMLDLVDDVIDLARLDAGRLTISPEVVDLPGLVQEAAIMVRSYIEAKGLEFKVAVDPSCPPLRLDRLRVRQVLLNLLVNATRFTEQGTIRVSVEVEGAEVSVKVTDTGKGIHPDEMGYLFEEFRAAEKSYEPNAPWHSGSGLGLPISKKFIELHHGRMGVESTPNKGTSIWFTLPVPAAGGLSETKKARPAGLPLYVPLAVYENSVQPPSRHNELAVVLVNPDKRTAHYLQRHLDTCRVIQSPDMETGLAEAEEVDAAALLIDPRDGEAPQGVMVPLISWELPSDRRVAFQLGAQDFLNKPVSREELFDAIDRLDRPVRRILVVDDDPEMVNLLRRSLSQRYSPSECLEASNGREALEVIRTDHPDLVLLDLMMPEMDGKEVLRHLANDPASEKPSVIVISVWEETASDLVGDIRITPPPAFPPGQMFGLVKSILGALV